MRLLNVYDFTFHKFRERDVPPYVAASHRWCESSETTLHDVMKRCNTEKHGYKKVEGFSRYIREHIPYVEWLWIDTCCINQDSEREVTQAVNSMFRWYNNAELCLAYLQDVKTIKNTTTFRQSEWFKRGWTLQELLAPRMVIFLTQDWHVIGHKGRSKRSRLHIGIPLEVHIAQITGIPMRILQDYEQSRRLSIEERLEWTNGRSTTYEEDMAYCLLGIFDVTMPIIYGEGEKKAKKRLLEEVRKDIQPGRVQTPVLDGNSALDTRSFPGYGQSFDCSGCQRSFDNSVALDQHRQNSLVHAPVFECSDCEKIFKSQVALDQHRQNSSAHAVTFACLGCEKSFGSDAALNQHQQDSPAHAPTFGCTNCGKSFNSEGALEQHRRDSPAHAPTFRCHPCNKSFSNEGALEQHRRNSPVHAPTFDCPRCDKSFTTKSALSQHVRDSSSHKTSRLPSRRRS